ncbi:hypothetical protein [Bacillus subtilis]|uniref:hypothetical protein n=1 Tax=Bacillus subtilis TaxID=1423 RepID=UPI002DBEFE9B|nr:hypothetical protein [Bacillus subtilis]MEC0429288.1 hypothetical protein [Bacillus subtilis]
MADKRVSIKTVHIDHGNDVVETIAVRDGGKTADILRAALASVEAPKIEVTKDSKTEITATLNVEVSEAITGLKALQREAKAATQALAELRDYMEATGGVTLKNGAEVAQSLRALFDRIGEEPTVYLDGKEIGKDSGRGMR